MPESETHNAVYRGRFAPSPTGHLHFGSLVAAVASYAQARSQHGEWLVRMEDLDRPREVPGMAAALLSELAAFGMESDQPVMYQSERDAAYQRALTGLDQQALTFACSCSRRDLREHAVYPGHCRDSALKQRPTAIRLLATDRTVEFADIVLGQQQQNIAQDVGDFVIKRVDGLFAYQLAVVVDDAAQGITEVVRGADLLGSTPRQIYLQQLLGLPTPSYLHVPLAVDQDGTKLSKQFGAQPIDPTKPIEGLAAAWQFLGQVELPPAQSPAMFWESAIARWSTAAVPSANAITVVPLG